MKKILMTFVFSVTAMASLAFADICQDITDSYNQKIQELKLLHDQALALTTDTSEQQAIRSTYEMQKAQLESEMNATLLASGCINGGSAGDGSGTDDGSGSGGDGSNGGDDGSNGGDDGSNGGDDGSNGGDDGSNGGDDGSNGGDDGSNGGDDGSNGGGDDTVSDPTDGVDQTVCEALMAEVKAEARRLANESGKGFKAGAAYANSRKAEIMETCGNYGRGRSLLGGNSGR